MRRRKKAREHGNRKEVEKKKKAMEDRKMKEEKKSVREGLTDEVSCLCKKFLDKLKNVSSFTETMKKMVEIQNAIKEKEKKKKVLS
uniref:Uncharacterized protein n=1 Tax=Cucumis melo TaxID=3656 RepID=A0A9I9DYF5_CUCME